VSGPRGTSRRQVYGHDPTEGLNRVERLLARRRERRRQIALVALIGLIPATALIGWAVLFGLGSPDEKPADSASVREGGPAGSGLKPSTQSSTDTAIAAAVENCRQAWTLQASSRAAAQRSLTQWRGHIDAMNKLTAGKITLPQAQQFWAQTRLGAKDNAAAFRAADLKYATSRARCAVPTGTADSPNSEDVEVVRACGNASAAGDKVLGSARVAISTWEEHIRHMELLRAGKMDPTHALHMWLQNWRAGSDQVRAYDAAAANPAMKTCSLP
jgi:hypothetical protein